MPRNPVVSETEAREIKARLWEGCNATDLAAEYYISQPTISNINTGRVHYNVPWPDGSVGGLPEHRRLALRKSKYRDSASARRLGERNSEPDHMANSHRLAREHGFDNLDDWLISIRQDIARKNAEEESKRLDAKMAEIRERHKDDPPFTPPPRIPFNPYTIAKVDWEDALEWQSKIPIIAVAEDENDEDTKLAICIVMKRSKIEQWLNPPIFLKLIAQVKEKIIDYREQNSVAS